MSISKRRRPRPLVSILCISMLQPLAAFHIHSQTQRRPRGLSPPVLAMSTPTPHVHVAIDQPILPRSHSLFSSSGSSSATAAQSGAKSASSAAAVMKVLSRWLQGDAVKVAAVALCAVLAFTLLARSVPGVRSLGALLNGRWQAMIESIRGRTEPVGMPMPFDDTDGEGWGVCTLRSKRVLGKTSFIRYDFDLPHSDYVLPLELGQKIEMCCLDAEDNVAKGDFYVYQPDRKAQPGVFSVLAPNRSPQENSNVVGDATADLVSVLKTDVRVGDEIALKPGATKLDYKGQYLPVTDMVYVAFGIGIAPVLEQVRAVLPKGVSSVKSVTVAWINDETKDFDVNSEVLEKIYYKYSNRMAVSCIVENFNKKSMSDSVEINEAIPDFSPGTMAVVSGPPGLAQKAVDFLEDRGYPSDTICVL